MLNNNNTTLYVKGRNNRRGLNHALGSVSRMDSPSFSENAHLDALPKFPTWS